MLKISKPKGDFFSKEKFNILWLCWKTRRHVKTNFGRWVINFSLISEPDKKRNTVNSVLDGLSSRVKHSEGREASLDKLPIHCSIAGCEGWHYFRLLRFPAITLEYLPKWVAQSAWHKKMKNNYFYISLYLLFLLSTCMTSSN